MKRYKVNKMWYTGDHWYDGTRFDNYLVELENHEDLYRVYKKYSPTRKVDYSGMEINCIIEEDKLKHIKILY